MATLIYLDTHVAVWLYLPRVDLFSVRARHLLETSELLISPIVVLELQYLFEVGRLRVEASDLVHSLHAQLGVRLCDVEFGRVVNAAVGQGWTRDPFDRVIVGQAIATERELLTRDETIREHCALAVW